MDAANSTPVGVTNSPTAPAQSPLLIASQCVPLFLTRLPLADAARLKKQYGLPFEAEREESVTLPLPGLAQFSDECARVAQDELLGFHVGAAHGRGRYGVLEYLARSAPTFRMALEALVKYSPLVNSTVRFSLEETRRGSVVLRHEVLGVEAAVGRHCNEYFAATMAAMFRELVQPNVAPIRVCLAHPAHGHVAEIERWFGCPVAFGQGHNSVEYPAELISQPMVTSDPALLKVLEASADRELGRRGAPDSGSLGARVRSLIPETVAAGGQIAERLAARLGFNVRTLQRRLATEAIGLRELIEDHRRREAIEEVGKLERPLVEVATRLGYSDLRAFNRAYRRWTGRTPTVDRAVRTSPQAPRSSAPRPRISAPPPHSSAPAPQVAPAPRLSAQPPRLSAPRLSAPPPRISAPGP